ncbi:MAG TPA: dihydrofolate reductase family protein, partial [Ilumatobacteraceae bacterium]|nr:dihydrofolate reductase family protein [Ilumatobacteraceae bacterium]
GTTFHFATGGIEDALERAFAAANGKDVRLMGGATTVRQYLAAGLVDEMHIALVPMLLGRGERVFPESSPPAGYVCTEHVATNAVVHLRFERR